MTTYAGTTAIFQVMSGATAGNKGGGFFNPSNANFPTDGVIAGGTGNAATLTPTSSYVPVAGDAVTGVMAFFPVQSGVTYPSWFPITGVAGGVATLNTAIGAGLQLINNRMVPNATAGCASTATPTLTYGIDYSRMTSARYTATTATGTTTAFADATNVPGKNWVGNGLEIFSGTGATAGWYECVSEAAGTVTLDRTAGTSYSVTTYYLGGAVSLGGSTTGVTDAIFFALGAGATTSGCRTFIQKGTYTPSAAITTLLGNAAWPSTYEGYNSVNGDRPSIASGNQPILSMTTLLLTISDYSQMSYCTIKGTASILITLGSSQAGSILNCKVINSSTASNHYAVSGNGQASLLVGCEVISYNGYAIYLNNGGFIIGCYIHDSNIGVTVSTRICVVINNIIASCTTYNLDIAIAAIIYGNTFYGAENETGIGIMPFENSVLLNNILYGFLSGYGGSVTSNIGYSDFNCFYNNTNNIAAGNTGTFLGANDLTTTNPSFTTVAQVTGTTATSSGTTLTDSGKNFTSAGVVAGRDYLYVISGTGATAGIYGITAVGTTTLTTDNSLGTISANGTYQITTGRNFLPTGNI